MNRSTGVLASVVLGLLFSLQACMHRPLQTTEVTVKRTPAELAAEQSGTARSSEGTVLWGGVILSSENVEEGSQLEVLSYPLDYLQRPEQHRKATGRFLIMHPEYLETIDYAPGRLVTVTGVLAGVATGKVGNTNYNFVQVVPDQLYLWSRNGSDHSPQLSIGIGISISN